MHLGKYGPGLIGLACGEIGRFTEFLPSIIGLQKPPGTMFKKTAGLGPAAPFNEIGRAFLEDKRLEWLFLTNDDHLYPADTIPRLLDRNVDAVTGLYFSRFMPFEPVMFDTMVPNPEDSSREWYHRRLMQPGDCGLIPIIGCGDGCLMLQRRVLEKIPHPWWEYGDILTDVCDHDMVLSRKIRAAGFELYCDLDVVVDHLSVFAIRPSIQPDGTWQTHLLQANRGPIVLPVASIETDVDEKGDKK